MKIRRVIATAKIDFLHQRPKTIRSLNVALMYNNAHIIDFLDEIRKKDHIVNTYSERHRTHLSKSKMRSQKIDTSDI